VRPRVNKAMFSGVLIRDPDLRKTSSGVPVCNATLAQPARMRVEGRWVDGEDILLDVTLWGERAEEFARVHHAGDSAYVEGRLRMDTWGSNGQTKTKLKLDVDEWQPISK